MTEHETTPGTTGDSGAGAVVEEVVELLAPRADGV